MLKFGSTITKAGNTDTIPLKRQEIKVGRQSTKECKDERRSSNQRNDWSCDEPTQELRCKETSFRES
jgi:hypothetical protein